MDRYCLFSVGDFLPVGRGNMARAWQGINGFNKGQALDPGEAPVSPMSREDWAAANLKPADFRRVFGYDAPDTKTVAVNRLRSLSMAMFGQGNPKLLDQKDKVALKRRLVLEGFDIR